MKNGYIISTLLLMLTIAGCKEKEVNHDDLFTKGIEQLYTPAQLATFTGVIIIPGEGCGNCISDASYYIMEHENVQKQYGVVFTGVKDPKTLKIQFKRSIFDNPNIIIDTHNYFMQDSVSSVYPQLVHLDNKKITSVELFSREKVTLK